MEFFHQQEAISILRIFLLAVSGAVVGVWCERVARAYVHVLDTGGEADAACLRAALRRAFRGFFPGPKAAEDSNPVLVAGAARALKTSVACAVLMSGCFAVLAALHGWTLYFMGAATACAMLLMLALIDTRIRLLPDALTLPLLWLGLALAWSGHGLDLHDAIAGAMLGYGFLWGLFWLFKLLSGREGMGYGDFKLLAALGAWLGWRPLAVVLLAACVMGVLLAMCRQRTFAPSGSYPFGPFLATSGLAALIAGSDVHLYFW
ncbi:MAG TPA: A24 family peptidase [Candidimonas sp.]|nr:A24 family peptidase [Candidimonas sp.]